MTGTIITLALLAAVGAVIAAILALRRTTESGEGRAGLEAQTLRMDRLTDAVGRRADDDREIREKLERTREVVDLVRAQAEERRAREEAGWDVIRRIEATLLGGATRGRAGENLLGEALASLPPGMLERDFAVNGKRVEFALVLPDGRRMPVDSKWAATRDVEDLEAAEDPRERESLARSIEDEVARRAREVASYVEASLTTPFAVACVPDAAYGACRKAHAEAFRKSVVLVPYSSALPVLLSLYALASRHGGAGDVEACLTELDGLLGAMEQTLENKVVRATTMLQNAADDWRTHLGRARGAVARGRSAGSDAAAEAPEPPPLQAVD